MSQKGEGTSVVNGGVVVGSRAVSLHVLSSFERDILRRDTKHRGHYGVSATTKVGRGDLLTLSLKLFTALPASNQAS